jgi:hypothetical protein
MRKKEYLSFQSARKFVHTLKLTNREGWKSYCKSGNKPDDVPSTPNQIYKKEWVGWGDWLGTGVIAYQNRNYLSYEKARDFVHKLKIQNTSQWREYCKSGNKPDNIPNNPWITYKNKGWISMGDWLGTGVIATYNIEYLVFTKARTFTRKLKLKDGKEWREYCKSGNKPDNIPNNPWNTYKDKGWDGIPDWLGNKNLSNTRRNFLSFKDAKKFVHTLKIKSKKDWYGYTKLKKFPKNIPKNPSDTYKDKGWDGWGDWLGTRVIAYQNRNYLSYEKARDFVHKLNIKNVSGWKIFSISKHKPDNIPANPVNTYKKQGTWISWGDWLGTGVISNQDMEYLSAKEAKPVLQKLFKEFDIKNGRDWRRFAPKHKKLLQKLRLPHNLLSVYSLKNAKKKENRKKR